MRRQRETPFIEVSRRPWFGPRAKAKRLLANRTHVASPATAARALMAFLGQRAPGIQWLRFYDFVHHDDGFRYTIVLVFTDSDEPLRTRLLNLGDELIRATGWYPLPQGERMGSRLQEASYSTVLDRVGRPGIRLGSSLGRITSAVDPTGGCCIRIETGAGDLLLDAGFNGPQDTTRPVSVVLLSHSHSDHIGGVLADKVAGAPVFMSRHLATILLAQGIVAVEDFDTLYSVVPEANEWMELAPGIDVRCFPVPHSPGATGFVLRDARRAIVYTGDVVLQTSRHDFLPTLREHMRSSGRTDITVLLDGTMAARPHGASQADTASDVLSLLQEHQLVTITARDPAQLLYAYIDLYFTCQQSHRRHTAKFILPRSLRPLFQSLHSAFIARKLDELDPYLRAQYGLAMPAWAETMHLYWRNADQLEASDDYATFLFSDHTELARTPEALSSPIICIGPQPTWLPTEVRGNEIDASPWTQHSSADTLREATKELAADGRIILFHDFPKRLLRAVRSMGEVDVLQMESTDA